MAGLEAVLFDWGGTLSVFVPVELADMWRLAAHHLDPAREEEIAAQLFAVENEFWADVARSQRSTDLAAIVAAASAALGLDVGEALLEEAAVCHLDAWTPHIAHDPDAAAVLAALRARGLRTAMLSNTHWPPAFHERFLERDGLAELLDARVYSSALEYTKPHRSAFEATLRAVGVDDPASAVFVGDRPYDDVYGAQQAGMRGVLKRHHCPIPDYEVEPDATIDTLPELLAYVDGLGAGA